MIFMEHTPRLVRLATTRSLDRFTLQGPLMTKTLLPCGTETNAESFAVLPRLSVFILFAAGVVVIEEPELLAAGVVVIEEPESLAAGVVVIEEPELLAAGVVVIEEPESLAVLVK